MQDGGGWGKRGGGGVGETSLAFILHQEVVCVFDAEVSTMELPKTATDPRQKCLSKHYTCQKRPILTSEALFPRVPPIPGGARRAGSIHHTDESRRHQTMLAAMARADALRLCINVGSDIHHELVRESYLARCVWTNT